MTDQSDTDLYTLFCEAAEIRDDALRESYLRERCGGDVELFERLAEMLSVREQADALFDFVAPSESGDVLGEDEAVAGLGRVGRFRLVRLVGLGGMGKVFLGYDDQLQRPAALKFPRVESLGNAELLERFLREARLAAQLSHPNLVEIYEVGIWREGCFIASQWCEGGDLMKWLREHPGPQPPQWSVRLLRSIARAVAYCHQQGVVHLDIKPANIILVSEREPGTASESIDLNGDAYPAVTPMLTDFGVARVIEEELAVTQTSVILGTPLYMSPEQAACRRDKIGPCSDIFALGVILYELLYGERPFEGDSAIEVLDQIRSTRTVAVPANRTITRELRTICQRCLEHEPENRYPSADALAEDLDRYLRGEPIHARPVSPFRRLGQWLERPERMVQAGITALVFHTMIFVNFATVLIGMYLGWASIIETDFAIVLRQGIQIALVLHVPSFAAAWMTIRRRALGVVMGLLLSIVLGAILTHVVVTGDSPMGLYQGRPLATFLQHYLLLCGAAILALAHAAAIPAAFRRDR